MTYNPKKHHRRSIRLKGYDYSKTGAYFITIVTHNRLYLFGEIINCEMCLNEYGKIAHQCWLDITNHFPHAHLDEFIIMPNHIHGIILLDDIGGIQKNDGNKNFEMDIAGAKNFSPLRKRSLPNGTSKTIGSIVRGFKIGVTKWFRQNTDIPTIWQRNYYEHIIRNENELNKIRQYVINNPLNWKMDDNYIIKGQKH